MKQLPSSERLVSALAYLPVSIHVGTHKMPRAFLLDRRPLHLYNSYLGHTQQAQHRSRISSFNRTVVSNYEVQVTEAAMQEQI